PEHPPSARRSSPSRTRRAGTPRPPRGSIRPRRRPRSRDRRGGGRCPARAARCASVAWPCLQTVLLPSDEMKTRFGPARVPSRENPEAAIELLVERGDSACEIDFEGGFWMKPDGEGARGSGD